MKGMAKIFLKGTKLPILLKTKRRGETNRGTKLPFGHYGEDEKLGLQPARERPTLAGPAAGSGLACAGDATGNAANKLTGSKP
jgi:hypothetical protein